MHSQASRLKVLPLAPQRPSAAGGVAARELDRAGHGLPVDSFVPTSGKSAVGKASAPMIVASAPAAPVMAREIRQVEVLPGDVLAMKAQPGDYFWKLARVYAKEDAVGSYAKELIARNGGSAIKVGQLLNLPVTESSDYELQLAIAVQKVVQLRGLFGEPTPELDWSSVEVGPGPVDSFWVSFKEVHGGAIRRFMVADDLSGLYPGRYSVMTEREARRYFPD